MIAEKVKIVFDTIGESASAVGRDPSEITLVAVTKKRSAAEIEEALSAGVTHLGENRIQEALAKVDTVKGDVVWHMVGHLQSNKAKKAVAIFDWIDSVDSMKLAEILSQEAQKEKKTVNVLIQVNISGEEVKSGAEPNEVKELVDYAASCHGLKVRGLMTIGSFGVSPAVRRNEFSRMKKLYETLREGTQVGSRMDVLSMGMSDDYRIAIEEGSTMVRVGTAIFGARQ